MEMERTLYVYIYIYIYDRRNCTAGLAWLGLAGGVDSIVHHAAHFKSFIF